MSVFFGDEISPRVSREKKEANNFARQIQIMDYIDMYFGDFRDPEENSRFDINYGLFNGDLDVNLYEDPICFNIEGEKVKLEHQTITHYPIISQVARAMLGELKARPFRPVAKHLGAFAQSAKNKKWNELLRELLQQEIIIPLQQEITTEYYRNQNIRDIFSLSPEEQQQVEADIANRIRARTPDEIIDFMENDYQTPTQRGAQQLLNYLVSHLNIKALQEEGFKHAIITGREYYYIGERYDEPVIELCNPKYLKYSTGGNNDIRVEDGDWAKYEQWFSYPRITQRHSLYLNKMHWRELEDYLEPIGGYYGGDPLPDPRKDRVMERTMYELSTDSMIAKKFGDIDIRDKEGQSKIRQVYDAVIKKYGMDYGTPFSHFGIRESHLVWRDKQKLFKVTRIERGKEVTRYFGEHYEPRNEDIKIVEVWADQLWEGTKLGSKDNNEMYLNIQPIPGQHLSIFNPWLTKLPYVGREYDTHMNNTKNVAPIDLGKPSNMEFDTLMAQIRHDMATDIGKVFMMVMNLKPDNMNWQEWTSTMKNGRLLMANLGKRGLNQFDINALKVHDLSRTSELAAKIQLAETFRQNVFQDMYFNAFRIGQGNQQYATNQNIQQTQAASYNQTEPFFDTHRQIIEAALNQLMNRAKLIYKDKPFKAAHIFSDAERLDLDLSGSFQYEEVAIEFKVSAEEIRKVEELRQRTQEFIQNGMSFDGVLKLALAETTSDIVNIFKYENKRAEEMRQEEIRIQQQQFEQSIQADMAEQEKQRAFEIQKLREQLASQEARAIVQSETLRKAEDVDGDREADLLTAKKEEIKSREKIEMAKLSKKDRELDIKEKEVAVKAKQAAKKPTKK